MGIINSIYCLGQLWGLDEPIHVKCLERSLVFSNAHHDWLCWARIVLGAEVDTKINSSLPSDTAGLADGFLATLKISSLNLCSPGRFLNYIWSLEQTPPEGGSPGNRTQHPLLWRNGNVRIWVFWSVSFASGCRNLSPRCSFLGKWPNFPAMSLENLMPAQRYSHPRDLPMYLISLNWNKATSLCNM